MANDHDRIQVRTDLFHDLANALIVVLGRLELLDRQPLEQEARRQLDRAQLGAKQGMELARHMLATAQEARDRNEATPVRV